MSSKLNSITRASLLVLLIIAFPAFLLAFLLAISAETCGSRIFVLSILLLYIAGATLIFIDLSHPNRALIPVSLFVIAFIGLLISYVISPTGNVDPNCPASSVIPPPNKFVRWSPANLVSEIDQLKLGALVIPYFDPLIDSEKGKRYKELFMDVYREMQSEKSFTKLGSAMHYAYADYAGFSFNTGHLYCYIPAHGDNIDLPVIMFLHGAFGNMQGYLWIWKQLADQLHVAVVAPTFGFGSWNRPAGLSTIENAYQFCVQHPALSEKQIILAGLSSGGYGISKAAVVSPEKYQGLIYISGVLDQIILNSTEFIEGWTGRPIFIIHGSLDDRLLKSDIDKKVQVLNESGLDPKVKFFDDEDHLLIFSKRKELMEIISQWIKSNGLFLTASHP